MVIFLEAPEICFGVQGCTYVNEANTFSLEFLNSSLNIEVFLSFFLKFSKDSYKRRESLKVGQIDPVRSKVKLGAPNNYVILRVHRLQRFNVASTRFRPPYNHSSRLTLSVPSILHPPSSLQTFSCLISPPFLSLNRDWYVFRIILLTVGPNSDTSVCRYPARLRFPSSLAPILTSPSSLT